MEFETNMDDFVVNQHALGYNFNTRQLGLPEIAILAVLVTAAATTALPHLHTTP